MTRALRMVVFAVAVIAAMGMPRDARAEGAQFSGSYLRYVCGVNDTGAEVAPGAHAACQAYISGVVDYHQMLISMKIAPEVRFCIPSGTTMNRLHAVVLDYLNRNNQHDSFVAAPAIVMALYEKFPCTAKKKKK